MSTPEELKENCIDDIDKIIDNLQKIDVANISRELFKSNLKHIHGQFSNLESKLINLQEAYNDDI